MHWICPLYKLSTCWAQQVERIWTPCWEVLSLVESNLKLVKLFAQHGSTFPLFRGHPCVAQQSRAVHLHSNAQRVEPTHAQCPAYPRILSHNSAWAFVKSSDRSTCWVIVEIIWTSRSTTPQQTLNMLRACTVDKSSAFARSLTDLPTGKSHICIHCAISSHHCN